MSPGWARRAARLMVWNGWSSDPSAWSDPVGQWSLPGYFFSLTAFNLSEELIAQQPLPTRDESRLLVLNRASGKIEHKHFREIVGCFQKGDVLVLNNSRVIRGLAAEVGGLAACLDLIGRTARRCTCHAIVSR